MHPYLHTYVRMYVNTYVHTYMHPCIHTCIIMHHMYICIYTQVCLLCPYLYVSWKVYSNTCHNTCPVDIPLKMMINHEILGFPIIFGVHLLRNWLNCFRSGQVLGNLIQTSCIAICLGTRRNEQGQNGDAHVEGRNSGDFMLMGVSWWYNLLVLSRLWGNDS